MVVADHAAADLFGECRQVVDRQRPRGQTAGAGPERELLLGTLIRIAPLPDNKLNHKQKLDLVAKTRAPCQKDGERANDYKAGKTWERKKD